MAVKGNQFWLLGSSYGGPPVRYRSGRELWDASCKYFQYVRDNPLLEEKAMVVDKVLERVSLPKMRAMTLTALQLHLGISHDTWGEVPQQARLKRSHKAR